MVYISPKDFFERGFSYRKPWFCNTLGILVGVFWAISVYFQHGLLEIITGFKIFSFWDRHVFSREVFAFAIYPAGPENFFPSSRPGFFRDFWAFFVLSGLAREGFPRKQVFLVEPSVIGRTQGSRPVKGRSYPSPLERCFKLWAVSGLFWTWRPVFGVGMFFFPQADIFSIFSAFAVCGADS